ncbi:pantothenate kinase [Alicyclobacillus hesperidum subsp. aegles]|uniref:type I pantothenate kinase n=1 Tax=Alicyclobacillus hesperidum TaxID=89784 RepID=UPI00222CC2FA|nr:type I pantothenate kinase [Alicyclobacillus hesperidum]GLG01425.1 pantothenate kinase [Alicyclobacillus hesperidum subsp. aegles]
MGQERVSKANRFSPFISFSREEWRQLRASTPLLLQEEDLARLHGINERVSLAEVEDIYLPLSRLLNLYVGATQNLYEATHKFLGHTGTKVPYIIGIAGSVAVGKSTTARIVQALLSRWPNHPKVDLVTTDGFLFPNAELERRGIMHRKGFPESYNTRRLIQFLADVKSGKPIVEAPVYSHLAYDIVPTEKIVVRQPDIVILEGLNVLQTSAASHAQRPMNIFVSDFFDFSIYVDAPENLIREWYITRFFTLRQTAFRNPESYFHRYASLTDVEAEATASRIWEEINAKNLRENILPTKPRAQLILHKGEGHQVQEVQLRKI